MRVNRGDRQKIIKITFFRGGGADMEAKKNSG